MAEIRQMWSQMFPPAPKYTEKDYPDQTGKVFIVTGGYSGVGFELVKILFAKNATVYIAGRSKEKGDEAIKLARATAPTSIGRLEFLFLDLADLSTIGKSAQDFLSRESRLDVLWNNAGVMRPPAGSRTKQNYETQLGTNCLGPFLFTQLLRPILIKTAASSPPNSVRVCWTSSLMAEASVPKGVIDFEDINGEKGASQRVLYSQSKAGNIFLGWEFARRNGEEGLISVTLNPGNLRSPLQRYASCLENTFNGILLYPPIFGAYTELFAGLSPDIDSAANGSYIIPWGRAGHLKESLAACLKEESKGGTGVAKRFFEWCENETRPYM
ncbi:NAD(P)-binding protein [Stipitochalara longipes BDJ]|nr:NAD(P)-binding protein [Stipitochalara longipes BDJ]